MFSREQGSLTSAAKPSQLGGAVQLFRPCNFLAGVVKWCLVFLTFKYPAKAGNPKKENCKMALADFRDFPNLIEEGELCDVMVRQNNGKLAGAVVISRRQFLTPTRFEEAIGNLRNQFSEHEPKIPFHSVLVEDERRFKEIYNIGFDCALPVVLLFKGVSCYEGYASVFDAQGIKKIIKEFENQ